MRQALALYSYSKVVLFAELFGIKIRLLSICYHPSTLIIMVSSDISYHLRSQQGRVRFAGSIAGQGGRSPHPVTEPVVYLGRNKFFPDLQCVPSTCKFCFPYCFSKSMKVSTENSVYHYPESPTSGIKY